MSVVKWDESYKTGHTVVDLQHEHLFQMVNELHDAIVAEKGREVMGPTLTLLADYTVKHFQTEEALMVEIGYPGLTMHREKHELLTKEVKGLIEKFSSGKVVLSITLSNFLAKWLSHHVKEDDMALIRYVKEHPERMAAKTGK